tara:strand:+ start:442 stop:846 length:405 start_codon:yes stop_codon:yes gene_type:complete
MTNNIKIHYFWYICITVRTIIASLPLLYDYLLKNDIHKNSVKKISFFTKISIFLMGLGFLYKAIFASNNEKHIWNQVISNYFTKVFWHKTRIVHALLFMLAGIYFNNYKLSSTILLIDVIFSIIYRFNSGHFNN